MSDSFKLRRRASGIERVRNMGDFMMRIAAAVTMLMVATPGAAAVNYDISGSYGGIPGKLSFSTDNLVSGTAFVPDKDVKTCDFQTSPGQAFSCGYVVASTAAATVDYVQIFSTSGFLPVSFYFPKGSLGAVGIHSTVSSMGNPGRLVVSMSAVPEPATWAMLMVGLGAIGANLRRRSSAKTNVRFA